MTKEIDTQNYKLKQLKITINNNDDTFKILNRKI